MYGYLTHKLFIDLTYELTVNTLGQEGEIPCEAGMDWTYDDCIARRISDTLHEEFGCVVPFLPPELNEGREVCDFGEEGEKRERLINRFK